MSEPQQLADGVARLGSSRRILMLVNCLFRLGYGAGAVLTPSAMATAQLAPDVEERPDARLFVRGFGAHQVAVAALGLASLRWPRLERTALALAIAIDAVDMVSAAAEARARGQMDADVVGGLAFSAAGAATAAAALRMRD
jgi:hypothetical protein